MNTTQLQTIKAAIDELLRPRNQVASMDIYLVDGFLIVPLARPPLVLEGEWRPGESLDVNEISIFDLMQEKTP